jgi:hypothetical protein
MSQVIEKEKSMSQVIKEKIKIGVGAAIGGAILTMIIGFNWGGWVTGGTAQEMGEEMSEVAVVDRLTPICVEQFKQDPEKDKKFKELKGTDSWKRDDYVIKQGWATMPYEKKPDRKVAEKCTEQIMQSSK